MNIGIVAFVGLELTSLRRQLELTALILREKHTLVYRTTEYLQATDERREAINRDFLGKVDVVLGPLEIDLFACRERVAKRIPYIVLLFGATGRGLQPYAGCWQMLNTHDILVGSCTRDMEVVARFFSNAISRNVPFPYDEAQFYPVAPARQAQVRAGLGIAEDQKVILYAGRITVEKNFHTIVKVFSVLRQEMPDLLLIVAGHTTEEPSAGMGVYPFDLGRALRRLEEKLNIPQGAIRYAGHQNTESLRELYSIADICVNMTLNHDENLGLAQVEAMGCGTPVVGSDWGGLADAIHDGITGHKATTVLTQTGVRVNWLEAVATILYLLRNDQARLAMRQACRPYVQQTFSVRQYREHLEALLADVQTFGDDPGEPLALTRFAQEFWDVCGGKGKLHSHPYCRGEHSFELYRQLIECYCGTPPASIAAGCVLMAHEIVCLATPGRMNSQGNLEIDDPIYPLILCVPEAIRTGVELVLGTFDSVATTSVEQLLNGPLRAHRDGPEVLSWMIDAGLLLHVAPEQLKTKLPAISPQINAPFFSVQRLDPRADLAVIDMGQPFNVDMSSASRIFEVATAMA